MSKNSVSTKVKVIADRSFCPITYSRPDSLPRGIPSSPPCASLLVTFISLHSVLGWQSALLFLQMRYVCIPGKVPFELRDWFIF